MKIDNEWFNDFFSARSNNILKRRESVLVEFKREFDFSSAKFKAKLVKTVGSFANNKGGIIIFGIADSPHEISGVDNFDAIDTSVVSNIFNTYLSPAIEFKMHTYNIEGKTIGGLQIFESKRKPIVCIKDGEKIFESDIFFRYGGQSSKIKSGDLIYLINDIKRLEADQWISLFEKVSKIGISDVGVFNIENGELFSKNNKFILDNSLISKIKFLDEYSEHKDGAAAVKIVGEVDESGSVIAVPSNIFEEDVFKAMLTENLISDPIIYLKTILGFNSPIYPIYFFLIRIEDDQSKFSSIIERIKSRSFYKTEILKRINDDEKLLNKSNNYSLSSAKLGKRRSDYLNIIKNSNQLNFNDSEDCRCFLEAVFHLNPYEFDSNHLRNAYKEIFENYYPFEKTAINHLFRWSLSYFDLITYKKF